MHNILLIAKREYLEKIRGRAFKLSTVLLPLLMGALLSGSYFTSRSGGSTKHIVIAANNSALADAVRHQLERDKDSRFNIEVVAPINEEVEAALQKDIQNKGIDGLLVLDTTSSATPKATYTSKSTGDFATVERLRYALNRGLLNARLTAAGMKPSDTDALLREIPVETIQVGKGGKESKSNNMAAFSKATIMTVLLTMPVLLYGLDMARSIIEEKSSRIFEVMLSVVRPDDMLAGKLIGVGAVGLTQVAIWVAVAAVLAGTSLASSLLTGDFAIQFTWIEAVLFPAYFLLGFFLYSSLFSGLAATCETAQELQMYTPLAAIPVWLSFGILPLILNDPNSVWAIVGSLFPLTAPFVMISRVGLEAVPLWQIGTSMGLMVLSIWGTLWFSSRLYRVGILMYGKRATIPELLRWLRYS
jgi:ABC-2 type transport system permease protein